MFKHLIALVLVVLAALFVSPAFAQQPPGANVGTLTCKMAPSIGLIFGSRQRMACRFVSNGPNPPEAYVGVMGTMGEASTGVQTAADALKDAVIACKAEISGVCGKILPGQGRIAACLLSNKSTASAGCVDAIQKIESMATQ